MAGEIISERRATSNRNGERDHPGISGDFRRNQQAEYAGKKKQTRRDRFLAEMEQVVPWARLVDRLRPFYPKGERGRPPVGLERMAAALLFAAMVRAG